MTVLRDGKRITLDATLAIVRGRKDPFLGIFEAVVFQRYSPVGAVAFAGSAFGEVLAGSAGAFAKLPAALPDLFKSCPKETKKTASRCVPRSKTPAGDVTQRGRRGRHRGPGGRTGRRVAYSVSDLLLIIISLNIFIGAFNLLPLLPLDGGHLAVIIYERIRAWLARIFGRPDPGLVDLQKLVPVSVGVFGLLIGAWCAAHGCGSSSTRYICSKA